MVFEAFIFVPVVTVYVCVVGVQQEREPRQYFHVQCNNQTHIIGPHIRYANHIAVAKADHTYYKNGGVLHFGLGMPPGYQVNPIPTGGVVFIVEKYTSDPKTMESC